MPVHRHNSARCGVARPEPRPLDIAVGMLIGTDPTVPRLRGHAAVEESPITAVQKVVRSALVRPPCLVSFSGGRDSSTVLAVAVDVARREGLPLPVPATFRYPDAAGTDETEWQELVVAHLGLVDWLRIEVRGELEALGPVATRVLDRHGLLFPPNAYAHLPLLESARGGSLLTGIGGDQMFGSSGSRVARLLAGRVRPVPRDLPRLILAASPRGIRARVAYRRQADALPWLLPKAAAEASWELAAWEASWPQRWDRGLDAWWRSRDFQAGVRALETLAAPVDVRVRNPFMAPSVIAAFAKAGGAAGFEDRTTVMTRFFADLLPSSVLARGSKAAFDEAIWGPRTREFIRAWDGMGIDSSLVDVAALRRTWASNPPDGRTLSLLQSAWLSQHTLG
ncbi:MAG: asparagine synthase-related protein [Egibacteraceae bacterium]